MDKSMANNEQRQCGNCSLCCKVLKIEAMDSPANKWCGKCTPAKPGGACEIFKSMTRPQSCHDFECLWLQGGMGKGEDFRPDKVKGVMVISADKQLVLYLDENYPDAYKKGRLGRFVHMISMRLPVIVVCGDSRKVCATGRQAKEMVAKLMEAVRAKKRGVGDMENYNHDD